MLVRLVLLAVSDSAVLFPCAMAANCRSSWLFCSSSWLHWRTAFLEDESSCRSCRSSSELRPLRRELSSLCRYSMMLVKSDSLRKLVFDNVRSVAKVEGWKNVFYRYISIHPGTYLFKYVRILFNL